jgi:hypothetical protein
MIDLRIKDLFFDRHVVMRAVDKAKREVLSRRVRSFARRRRPASASVRAPRRRPTAVFACRAGARPDPVRL